MGKKEIEIFYLIDNKKLLAIKDKIDKSNHIIHTVIDVENKTTEELAKFINERLAMGRKGKSVS